MNCIFFLYFLRLMPDYRYCDFFHRTIACCSHKKSFQIHFFLKNLHLCSHFKKELSRTPKIGFRNFTRQASLHSILRMQDCVHNCFCVVGKVSVSEGRRPEEESSFWKISAERSRLEGEQADFQSLTPSQIKSIEKGEKPLPSYLRQVRM